VRELSVPLLLIHPPQENADFGQEPAIKHVLVALDGTARGEHVIPAAVELAKAVGARVTLFRAVWPNLPLDFKYRYSGAFVPAQVREMAEELKAIQGRQMAEAEDYLRGVADRIQSQGVHATVKVCMEESPAEAILREAGEADLVALATHGRGGLKRLYLGSVADKVIRGSAFPSWYSAPRYEGAIGMGSASGRVSCLEDSRTTSPNHLVEVGSGEGGKVVVEPH
jgi:nucleotide-binding universal stress UspA family protein